MGGGGSEIEARALGIPWGDDEDMLKWVVYPCNCFSKESVSILSPTHKKGGGKGARL